MGLVVFTRPKMSNKPRSAYSIFALLQEKVCTIGTAESCCCLLFCCAGHCVAHSITFRQKLRKQSCNG